MHSPFAPFSTCKNSLKHHLSSLYEQNQTQAAKRCLLGAFAFKSMGREPRQIIAVSDARHHGGQPLHTVIPDDVTFDTVKGFVMVDEDAQHFRV